MRGGYSLFLYILAAAVVMVVALLGAVVVMGVALWMGFGS